jgi:hypothetical protein
MFQGAYVHVGPRIVATQMRVGGVSYIYIHTHKVERT